MKAVQEIVADLRKADMFGIPIDAGHVADDIELAFGNLTGCSSHSRKEQRMETLSNIVAEMREKAAHFEKNSELMVSENAIALFILPYADRIEAAWKRERVEVATKAATDGVRLTNEKYANTPIGNSAAMREALDAALRFIGNLEIEPYSPLDEDASELRQKIMDALAAPARNCDIYPKRDDAGEAWNKTLDERTRDMVQRYPLTAMDMFIDWLLAYAEGGGVS